MSGLPDSSTGADFLALAHWMRDSDNASTLPPDLRKLWSDFAFKARAFESVPELWNPKEILDSLVEAYGASLSATDSRRSDAGSEYGIGAAGDPGRILLELFAMLHSGLSLHLSQQIAASMQETLKLAGHVPFPARPAVTALAIAGNAGVTVKAAELRARARELSLAGDGRRLATFTNVWAVTCWTLRPMPEELSERRRLRWAARVPKRQDVARITALPGFDTADRRWRASLANGKWKLETESETVPIRLVAVDELLRESEVPPSLLIEGDVYPDQWLCFDVLWDDASSPTPSFVQPGLLDESEFAGWVSEWRKAQTEATGEFVPGWLVWEADSAASLSELGTPPNLFSNIVPAVNLVAADALERLRWPGHDTAGDAANGLRPGEWTLEPNVSKLRVWNTKTTSGGRGPETDEEYLLRAPRAFRHRGVAATTRDWEDVVRFVDTRNRISGVVVREASFAYDGGWGKGVEIAYDCRGPVLEAARVAAGLYAEIVRTAEAMRPLGIGVRVCCPRLVPYRVRISRAWLAAGISDDEAKDAILKRLNLDQLSDRPSDHPLWQRLRDNQRRPDRLRRTTRETLMEYLRDVFPENAIQLPRTSTDDRSLVQRQETGNPPKVANASSSTSSRSVTSPDVIQDFDLSNIPLPPEGACFWEAPFVPDRSFVHVF